MNKAATSIDRRQFLAFRILSVVRRPYSEGERPPLRRDHDLYRPFATEAEAEPGNSEVRLPVPHMYSA